MVVTSVSGSDASTDVTARRSVSAMPSGSSPVRATSTSERAVAVHMPAGVCINGMYASAVGGALSASLCTSDTTPITVNQIGAPGSAGNPSRRLPNADSFGHNFVASASLITTTFGVRKSSVLAKSRPLRNDIPIVVK